MQPRERQRVEARVWLGDARRLADQMIVDQRQQAQALQHGALHLGAAIGHNADSDAAPPQFDQQRVGIWHELHMGQFVLPEIGE